MLGIIARKSNPLYYPPRSKQVLLTIRPRKHFSIRNNGKYIDRRSNDFVTSQKKRMSCKNSSIDSISIVQDDNGAPKTGVLKNGLVTL